MHTCIHFIYTYHMQVRGSWVREELMKRLNAMMVKSETDGRDTDGNTSEGEYARGGASTVAYIKDRNVTFVQVGNDKNNGGGKLSWHGEGAGAGRAGDRSSVSMQREDLSMDAPTDTRSSGTCVYACVCVCMYVEHGCTD
jgi:hypothetical protein